MFGKGNDVLSLATIPKSPSLTIKNLPIVSTDKTTASMKVFVKGKDKNQESCYDPYETDIGVSYKKLVERRNQT